MSATIHDLRRAEAAVRESKYPESDEYNANFMDEPTLRRPPRTVWQVTVLAVVLVFGSIGVVYLTSMTTAPRIHSEATMN